MKAGSAFITPLSALALELLRPHLKADPAARLFDLRRHDLHEAAQPDRCRARDGAVDAARPAAHRRDDPRPGGLFARTDRRAAGAYPQGRDGGLCAMGQVRSCGARWRWSIERSLRETLDGEPTAAIKAAA